MSYFTTPGKIVVTCKKRLAPYLAIEITELGFTPVRVFATGVELEGTINDCIKLNLNLRCGSQVLYSIKEFSANGPDQLYERLMHIPWEKIIPKSSYFSVTSNVTHPDIRTPLFANVKVKDAIADRFRRQSGARPNSGPELDKVVINLYWRDDFAEVFIDTSGETLAKHGYRKIPGRAPMLEALAAATILATHWDQKSPFVNPMCGSGTLAIEAAMLAGKRMPGLFRDNYAFMHILGYNSATYEQEYNALKTKMQHVEAKIIASDISEDAIQVSRKNAAAAGVEKFITFEVCDFEETTVPETDTGIVFLNPEYGERMGQEAELEATYGKIGDFLKQKCKGYFGYIFTGNMELAKKVGLKAKRRIEFYNSNIDCRLLEYELYAGSKRLPKQEEAEN